MVGDKNTLIENALGSATAGIISRIVTHPLDTAKARLQANLSHYSGPFDVLTRTYRLEGFRGLYRGFSAVIVGGTPGTMAYLMSYEIFKDSLSGIYEKQTRRELHGNIGSEFAIHFTSGMLAETVACIIYVPVDVVKERLQVQSTTNTSKELQYKGSWDAVKKIARYEGLPGIYKGCWATLASFGPFSAFYFVFFERLKYWTRQQLAQTEKGVSPSESSSLDHIEIPFPSLLACAASAGALASFITSPLDMAKLRLQVQRGNLASNGHSTSNSSVSYRGMVDCLRQAYLEGGIRGLFRGAGARMLHFAPATTVTMTCYEQCRSMFGRLLE